MKSNTQSITYMARPIRFEIYSFIGIVKTYYDLPSNVTDRVVDIFASLDNNYHNYFGTIRYENVVLAATIFAVREFQQHFVGSKSPPFDIIDIVTCLYGEEKVPKNIQQIYYVLSEIQFIFGIPIDINATLPVTN